MTIDLDGKQYDVAHQFSPNRVVVNYDGLFVFADGDGSECGWYLSGVPARDGEEKDVMKKLTAPMEGKTEVTIIKE